MGFIKDIGKLAGGMLGATLGLPVYLAGEIVNSDFLREIGDGVFKVTEHTGELLGNVTEGVTETVYGIATSDSTMQSNGVSKVVDSGVSYVKGVANGVIKTAENGIYTTLAILDGDTDKAIKVGKELIKTAAVASIAIGINDVLDGLDVFDDTDDVNLIENPNIHHVRPHERTLPDGRTIWVDGDGDTSIDTYDGWYQSNPDYRV